MKNDLIDRYLYAVTKRMNPKIREDVKNELSSLIDDMLAERCGNGTPAEKDIRVVLTELGTPQELYAKYSDDGDKCLIGQPYYGTYLTVMKIVLAAVAIGMTVSSLILHFEEVQLWYETALSWLSLLWSGCLQAFAVVTLIFAGFSRSGVKLESWNLDDLPPVPRKSSEIKRGDCLFLIGFCVVFVALFLVAADHICVAIVDGQRIPMFTEEGTQELWYLVLPYGILGILRETVKLIERSYTRKVFATAMVVDALSALLAILWLGRPGLMNPAFTECVSELFQGNPEFIVNIFSNFNQFLLAVMLLALVLDAVETAVRTFRK